MIAFFLERQRGCCSSDVWDRNLLKREERRMLVSYIPNLVVVQSGGSRDQMREFHFVQREKER